jgi:hypothetical protein
MQQVLSKARKFAKADVKAATDDLEAKIDAALNEHDAEWVQRPAASASADNDNDKENAPANAPGADAPAPLRGKAKPKAAAAKAKAAAAKGAKGKKAPAAKRGARAKKRGSSSAGPPLPSACVSVCCGLSARSWSQARTRQTRVTRNSRRKRRASPLPRRWRRAGQSGWCVPKPPTPPGTGLGLGWSHPRAVHRSSARADPRVRT